MRRSGEIGRRRALEIRGILFVKSRRVTLISLVILLADFLDNYC